MNNKYILSHSTTSRACMTCYRTLNPQHVWRHSANQARLNVRANIWSQRAIGTRRKPQHHGQQKEWITAPSNWGKQNDGKQGRGGVRESPLLSHMGGFGSVGACTQLKKISGGELEEGESRSAESQRNNHSWENIWRKISTKDSLRLAWFTQLCRRGEETSLRMKVRNDGAAPCHRKHYFMSIRNKRRGGLA